MKKQIHDGYGVKIYGDYELENENDDIPNCFIKACEPSIKLARKRWQNTKLWRLKNGIDNILSTPEPNYQFIMNAYPHFYGRSPAKNVHLYIERPGLGEISKLSKRNLSVEDILRHYVYRTEYLFRVFDNGSHSRFYAVFDIENFTMTDLASDKLAIIKACSTIISSNYPERAKKIYIINSPTYISFVWNMISSLLDVRTIKKINFFSRNDDFIQDLSKEIGFEYIPECIGGGDKTPIGESAIEKNIANHVFEINKNFGIPNDPNYCIPAFKQFQ